MRPYYITDDNLRANIENPENKAAEAKAEAKRTPLPTSKRQLWRQQKQPQKQSRQHA